ncbi:Uncharacterised protein [Achromobacter insolitus]|nr:hypothetical protein LMG6003_02210 [Achromobacter insolitus]VEG68773.1 Uncharacterised protein [Achromobacter insolitus]
MCQFLLRKPGKSLGSEIGRSVSRMADTAAHIGSGRNARNDGVLFMREAPTG